ncbi:asparagine-linked glycosylation 13 homolog (S. cerevisiae) [Nesidiocoris tenuis]|uniref:Asparagine-linked glycosylation 13 homolog (S. cerevisiae) n=1 Tax=Nesidiocoris tenuis TaxID=355587 RepID=A0ABN7B8E2_9HEMI|nr:asparagine-linked glycosylation 13 homolog (S. cerevisiae) [Nesidiocoris tenuis]
MEDPQWNVAPQIQQKQILDGKSFIVNFSQNTNSASAASRRKTKPPDRLDSWLDEQGFYRKHTARDESCLFRAVSEQLFRTQVRHSTVRRSVVEYLLKNSEKFQKMTDEPIDIYAERMRSSRTFGGNIEIVAMSQLYECDFILYKDVGQPAENFTKNGYKKKIVLCNSPDNHYDSVYTNKRISDEGFCQSIVYSILYKEVFNMEEVDYTWEKMLHDKPNKQRDRVLPTVAAPERYELRENRTNAKELLEMGITPFPYKVAKALNPDLYRNVEFDTWKEYRKGLRYGFWPWTCSDLEVGVRCSVTVGNDTYNGFIQSMAPNKGPVEVFAQGLGKKITVPYESLKMLPPPPITLPTPRAWSSQKASVNSSQRKNHVPQVGTRGGEIVKIKRPTTLNFGLRYRTKDDSHSKEDSLLVPSPQQAIVTGRPPIGPDTQHVALSNDQTPRPLQGCPCDGNLEGSVDFDQSQASGQTIYMPADGGYQYVIVNPSPQLPASQSQLTKQVSPTAELPMYVNHLVRKSVLHDGSDLPFHDIATLQFCFNLGVDTLRYHQWSTWGVNAWGPGQIPALPSGPCDNRGYLAIENQSSYVDETTIEANTQRNPQGTANQSYVTYAADSTTEVENGGNLSPCMQDDTSRLGEPVYDDTMNYGPGLIQVPEVSSTLPVSPAEQDNGQPAYHYLHTEQDQSSQVHATAQPVQYNMYNMPPYTAVYTYTVPCVSPDGTIYYQTCFAPQPVVPPPQSQL